MSSKFTIHIVVDNEPGPGLAAEHGFSVWIHCKDRVVLFDTGQGEALIPNLSSLGLDPSEITDLVLSHGHYDHGGGIARVLKFCPQAVVHLHPGAVVPRYALDPGGDCRYIGLPGEARSVLSQLPDNRLDWVTSPISIDGNIQLTGPIPRKNHFEDPGGPFYSDLRCQTPDIIADDQALWLGTSQGPVVICGCAHAGVINTLDYVREISGTSKIRAVLGGFHLKGASEERIDYTIRGLEKAAPEIIMPCHCTGKKAVKAMKSQVPGLKRCFSGQVLHL
ncbi:MAG: MBL fold metallo-hydrolase [Desulfonatronovibrionaceae bacterium]